jgi:thiol-disulfide isomerase/thioredoxin
MAINNPTMQKTLSLIAYISLAAAVAFIVIDRHAPTLPIHIKAPIDEKLNLLNGTSITFRKLLKTPLVINFWASWCPPCIKELPTLSKIAKKYRGQVFFIGATVASDKKDVLAAKKSFLIDYELALVSEETVTKWQAEALPTTYIIDPQGTIIWAKSGISSEDQLEKAIRLALKK